MRGRHRDDERGKKKRKKEKKGVENACCSDQDPVSYLFNEILCFTVSLRCVNGRSPDANPTRVVNVC